MKIGVLGTGIVGRTISAALAERGDDVVMGTRDIARSLAYLEKDRMGNEPLVSWLKDHPAIHLEPFPNAGKHGELVINAINGSHSLEALTLTGSENLAMKVLIDISNPLDFSRGMPPSLTICNTDSLAEQIQRTFPDTRVVKALNTMNAAIMVDPGKIAGGQHHVFLCGNDPSARKIVGELLVSRFGWSQLLDLGGLESARGLEMVLPLWLSIMKVKQTSMFNFTISE